jgi:4'-phosphopantetheinyl transferase
MPIYKSISLDSEGLISVWEITESQQDLFESLKGSPLFDLEYNAISHERKKTEYLASRSLLQSMCGSFDVMNNGLYKDEHGKPFLKNSNGHISISHSHNMCAAIIHKQKEVGIDIQQIEEKLHLVAKKYLSKDETGLLNKDLEHLCIAWCCKEALYKQTGLKGMSLKDNFKIYSEPANGVLAVSFEPPVGVAKLCEVKYLKIEDYILAYSVA